MLDYIKERIALIMLLVAGDSISLVAFIKAPEIRTECTSLAAAISLLLMLMISLSVIYLLGPLAGQKKYMAMILAAAMFLWIGFIFSYVHFSGVNSQYGKISYSKVNSPAEAGDSTIVGGCEYCPEAQREVDAYKKQGRTLPILKLLGDFNLDTAKVWTEEARDCARKNIILSFSVMIAFLVAGLTLTYEFISLAKKTPKDKP